MAAMPLVVVLAMLAVPCLDPKGRNFERFRGVYLGMSAALTPSNSAILASRSLSTAS